MGSKEETGESVYSVVIWNTDNGKLTFFKAGIKKGTGTGSLGTAEVIAENVTQFAADIHDVAEAHTVRFKLVTEVNGRKVEKTETVTLRNDIVIALPGTE